MGKTSTNNQRVGFSLLFEQSKFIRNSPPTKGTRRKKSTYT